MTQSLQPHRGGYLNSRLTSRALAQLDQRTGYAVAVVQAEADIHAAKVDGVGFVAQRAMQAVA